MRLRTPFLLLGLTAAYFAAGKLGLMLAFQFPSASPVWPPTGIAIAAFLLYGYRCWPAILLGAFFVNLTTAGSMLTSTAIAVGNTLEGATAALLIRQFAGGGRFFERVQDFLRFAFVSLAATMISPTVGVSALLLAGYQSLHGVPGMWFTWWLGDVVGALTVTPLILIWVTDSRLQWNVSKAVEAAFLGVSLGLLGITFFSTVFFRGSLHYPLAYLSILPVLWAAIRFTPRETVTLISFLSCFAIAGTIRGTGPFVVGDPNTSLMLLQAFIAVVSLTGLILAAALRERMVFERSLEEKVRQRTRELELSRERDRANLQRLRATISHLPVGALVMDEEGHILELNDMYCRMFSLGMSAEEAKKISQEELLSNFRRNLLQPDEHMEKVRDVLSGKQTKFGEEIILRDGSIILRDFISIYEDGHYRGHLFTYRDVTKERRIDRAKSEFMSLASHQLRTPLTSVRWSMGWLKRELSGTLNELQEKFLTEGQKAVARMSDTIDTMLKISCIEADSASLKLTVFDLYALFEEERRIFQAECLAKRQRLLIDCLPGLSVRSDKTFLREILGNLLQNAVKYTPEGGTVTLRARRKDGELVIEVEDTGYGIPAHQQQKVFQKFFRGDNVVGRDTTGTGLGLYLVSLITDVLQGSIAVRSEEGKGTLFTVTLPSHVSDLMQATVPSLRAETSLPAARV